MTESEAAVRHFYAQINHASVTPSLGVKKGSSEAAIYSAVAQEGGTTPALVFQMLSAINQNTQMRERSGVRMTFAVKLQQASESAAALHTLSALVDARLHKATTTQGSFTVDSYQTESWTELPEVADGKRFQHLVSVYEVWVRPTS